MNELSPLTVRFSEGIVHPVEHHTFRNNNKNNPQLGVFGGGRRCVFAYILMDEPIVDCGLEDFVSAMLEHVFNNTT